MPVSMTLESIMLKQPGVYMTRQALQLTLKLVWLIFMVPSLLVEMYNAPQYKSQVASELSVLTFSTHPLQSLKFSCSALTVKFSSQSTSVPTMELEDKLFPLQMVNLYMASHRKAWKHLMAQSYWARSVLSLRMTHV